MFSELSFAHQKTDTQSSALAQEVREAWENPKEFAKQHERGLIEFGILAGSIAAISFHADKAFRKFVAAGDARFLRYIDHYISDLDRTLLDSTKAFNALSDELTGQLVKNTGLDEAFVRKAIRDTYKAKGTHLFFDRLELMEPVQNKFPGVNLNERFPEIAPSVAKAYHAALMPPQDVFDTLDFLRSQGKRLYLFTAGTPISVVDKLEATGLGKYFEHVFTAAPHPLESQSPYLLSSEETLKKVVTLSANPKQDERAYIEIILRQNLDPRKTLMLGDNNLEDIANARKAGLRAAQANWFIKNTTEHSLPDIELSSPAELKDLINRSK